MSLPDYKSLKKLTDACRKLGIKSFKNSEFEFTLSEDAPVSNYKKRKEASKYKNLDNNTDNSEPSVEGSLTEDEMLFWSANDPLEDEDQQTVGQ